jgi:hypothetical protein
MERRAAIGLVGLLVVGAVAAGAHAALYLDDNFGTYASGDLVGQNAWAQLGTRATVPLQVTGGQVVIPYMAPTGAGGSTVDNQDAYKSFTSAPAPASGTTSVFVGAMVTVNAAVPYVPSVSSPSYFMAMSDTATGFANERFTAEDDGSGQAFFFGARVTGQAGYPWAFGGALNYGQTYKVIMQADMVAGASNDQVKLYVDPTSSDLGSQTPYATATGTGTGTDPTALGVLILSQYYAATTGQDGVTIGALRVSDNFADAYGVPEPATLCLLALGGLSIVRRRSSR